jgi:hypothetical protein
MASLEKLRVMRRKYGQVKEVRKGTVQVREVREWVESLGRCPEILVPHLEALLDIGCVDREPELRLLYYVVWHCKVEYLSFWIYNDLKMGNQNKENFSSEFLQELANSSTDLKNLFDNSKFNLAEFAEEFYESIGTSIIPISQYGRYLENLNS